MMSVEEVCNELCIDREFAAERFGYKSFPIENILLLPCQIESLANAWADETDEDFEVEEDEVFKVDLMQLAEDLEIRPEIVVTEVYQMFFHTVYEGTTFFAFLYEREVQDLCDFLAEKYDLDFEGELA